MPETLCPVQLLWVNLVTDGLPATALGFNKPEQDIMQRRPRQPDEPIVDRWLLMRYITVGAYVGMVTVGGFAWWYMFNASGPRMSWQQLTNFKDCVEGTEKYSCDIFWSNRKASTMSMTILVVVEMFNALNALSENGSLLHHSPSSNLWLMGAIAISILLHVAILYIPWLAAIFNVMPLSVHEWLAVINFSFPVILIDEVLKFFARIRMVMKRSSYRRGLR